MSIHITLPIATINSQTGLINWTASTAGSYSFKVTASDGKGGSTAQTFTLTVKNAAPPNRLPVASNDNGTVDEEAIGQSAVVFASKRKYSRGKMKTNIVTSPIASEALNQPAAIFLVVLNVYATTSKHLYAYLSEGATIST